jgi:NhaP-type Na+/H+ or K+/H+ antiporter
MSEDPYLYVAFWSFLVTFVTTILVSLVTPKVPLEELRGLVYGLLLAEPDRPKGHDGGGSTS